MLDILSRSSTAHFVDSVTHELHCDIETRSCADLRRVGAHVYATDPTTTALCAAYAVDHGSEKLWWRGDPPPPEFFEVEADPGWRLVAHHAVFEAEIGKHVLHPRFGFPLIPSERYRCTMIMALAVGLPARLSALANALELEHCKDSAGERLMHQMSKPRRARKDEDPDQIHWFDDGERLERLGKYARRDLKVGREAYYRLPPLSARELQLWQLSERINQRGFCVDRSFAEAARRIAQAAGPEIDAEIAELTGGAVTTINQVAKLTDWLHSRGCTSRSLNRKALKRQLEKDDLPPIVDRVVELRLGGAQSAVKKLDAMLLRAGSDDRVRGSFRFHGAATGRWSAEGFQPQNLKRPVVEDLPAAIAAVATGDYQHVKSIYPQPLSVLGDCTRSSIIAASEHRFVGGDFSNIESRGLAWLVGENWKLESYRRYDATRDPKDEPYCITACKIYRKPPGSFTKDSPERNVGKTCDLAFGYQGGLNAWRNFSDEFSDAEVEAFKSAWRAQHPATCRFWYAIDDSAVLALRNIGQVVRCGRIDLKYTGAFLLIKLPSGRKISYPQPRLITVKDRCGRDRARVVFKDNSAGQFKDCRNGQGAYGGLWVENIVSGIARDLLAAAMLRVEAAGYPIVLHVHDELVCEVPEGFGSVDEFTQLMTRKPSWALELPISANAWMGPRYCK